MVSVTTRNWNATSTQIGPSRRRSNLLALTALTAIASLPIAPMGLSPLTILTIPVNPIILTNQAIPMDLPPKMTGPTNRAILPGQIILMDQTIPTDQITPTSLTTPTGQIIPTSPTTLTSLTILTSRITHTGRVVVPAAPSTLLMPLSSFRFPRAPFSSTPTARPLMAESSSTRTTLIH